MNLESKIESLLFISGRPMSARELADLIKCELKDVEEAGDKLVVSFKEKNGGTQIIKNASSFQMVTSSENAELIKGFVKDETTGELSRPSMETLTIIAYRGPVSKTDLDRIRGINCSLILRNLLIRGLIEVKEDKSKDESYYSVTFDFLRFLGLNEVTELPEYERLSQDDTIDRILEDNPLMPKIKTADNIVETQSTAPAEITKEEVEEIVEEVIAQEVAIAGNDDSDEEGEEEDEDDDDDLDDAEGDDEEDEEDDEGDDDEEGLAPEEEKNN